MTLPDGLRPEMKSRINIDKMLTDAGYVIQNMKEFNRTESLGVAVREYPTESGPVDYLLWIEGKPVGVVEAKKEDQGAVCSPAASWRVPLTSRHMLHECNICPCLPMP